MKAKGEVIVEPKPFDPVTPTLPVRAPGAARKPVLRRQSLDYDTNAEGDESGIRCPEPTLTQQQFAEEADINFIADRYGLTGELPTVLQLPRYGDFTGIFDFQSAQNAVVEAKQQFMTLPAKLRARFDNNPQKLLDFLENPDNKDEAIFLGLMNNPEDTPGAKPSRDSLQSPPDDAAAKGKGDTLSPEPKASAKSPKTPKTDP